MDKKLAEFVKPYMKDGEHPVDVAIRLIMELQHKVHDLQERNHMIEMFGNDPIEAIKTDRSGPITEAEMAVFDEFPSPIDELDDEDVIPDDPADGLLDAEGILDEE